MAICLSPSVKLLNQGTANSTNTMAKNNAMNDMTTDSARNWRINCGRKAPMTFLKPTSLARLADLAVVMFIKLIQAIKRINSATAAKI